MKKTPILISIFAALSLSACTESNNYDFEASREAAEAAAAQEPATTFEANFSIDADDPTKTEIPFPNNLLFAESQDGTLNIPVTNSEDYSNPQVALNTLDGFSTTAPISASFSQAIDPTTAVLGESVLVFELTINPQDGTLLTAPVALNESQIDVVVPKTSPENLLLLPLTPLNQQKTYLVVLTNGIKNTEGSIAVKSTFYHLASGSTQLTGDLEALEPVRATTTAFENVAEGLGVDKSTIVLSWTFNTQSITPTIEALTTAAAESEITMLEDAQLSNALGIPGPQGVAKIYAGAITVPYYQTAPTAENPLAALNGFMKTEDDKFLSFSEPLPKVNSQQTIPLLLSVPATGDAPNGGWPVVIFQHGITQDRSNLLALADALASVQVAAIAIDMPMHGLTEKNHPLITSFSDFATLNTTERTFDLDLVSNDESRTPGGDGKIDGSGTHFYNLTNLLNARDNLRQAVSDLAVLRNSLGTIDVEPLNTNDVGFIGHSLGGMVGTVYLSQESSNGPATLAMPGGGIARLLANSESFGPAINAGLADQGAPQGSADYEAFLTAAQTVVDSGDPINFARLVSTDRPVHLIEVVGGSAGSPSDQVIPNFVPGAPLSGTDPLIDELSLGQISESAGDNSQAVRGFVRFNSGTHSSLLTPLKDLSDLPVTTEMQSQVAGFMANGGKLLPISNTDVIASGNQ